MDVAEACELPEVPSLDESALVAATLVAPLPEDPALAEDAESETVLDCPALEDEAATIVVDDPATDDPSRNEVALAGDTRNTVVCPDVDCGPEEEAASGDELSGTDEEIADPVEDCTAGVDGGEEEDTGEEEGEGASLVFSPAEEVSVVWVVIVVDPASTTVPAEVVVVAWVTVVATTVLVAEDESPLLVVVTSVPLSCLLCSSALIASCCASSTSLCANEGSSLWIASIAWASPSKTPSWNFGAKWSSRMA